jgi:hypothetical protein
MVDVNLQLCPKPHVRGGKRRESKYLREIFTLSHLIMMRRAPLRSQSNKAEFLSKIKVFFVWAQSQ